MIGSTVNGTIGSLVLDEHYGKFLNQPVQLNSVVVNDNVISSSATNEDLLLDPDGIGSLLIKSAGATRAGTAQTCIMGSGLDVYRQTATASKDVISVWSDVGGTGTRVATIEANGDFESATNSYGSLSDRRLKQGITASSSQWLDIKNVELKNYKMISDVEQHGEDALVHIGVIAQDLEAAGMGGLVKERVINEDTGESVKSVKYSILLIKALGALKEAMARIEALEKLR